MLYSHTVLSYSRQEQYQCSLEFKMNKQLVFTFIFPNTLWTQLSCGNHKDDNKMCPEPRMDTPDWNVKNFQWATLPSSSVTPSYVSSLLCSDGRPEMVQSLQSARRSCACNFSELERTNTAYNDTWGFFLGEAWGRTSLLCIFHPSPLTIWIKLWQLRVKEKQQKKSIKLGKIPQTSR